MKYLDSLLLLLYRTTIARQGLAFGGTGTQDIGNVGQ
jgi:hypothetical protein